MVDRLITSYPPPTQPGIYGVISAAGPSVGVSGLGVVAIVGKASFGPINQAVVCGSPDQVTTIFGNASANDRSSTISTLSNLAREAAIGGAIGFVAVRPGGSGGTTASVLGGIMDNASTVVGQMMAASPGVFGNQLSVTIRPVAGTTTQKELVVYRGSTIVQDTRFQIGATPPDEAGALAAATVGAAYVVFTKSVTGSGVLASINQVALSGGGDPSVAAGDYTTAFSALSSRDWATLVTDSENTAVFAAIQAYVDNETAQGRFRTACVGEATSVSVTTRYSNASNINSALVRYQGVGFTYPNGDGTFRTDEGYLAAATDAGILSTLTPGTSMTWRTIPGATGIVTSLPSYDEATAILSGMGYYKYSATLGVRTGAGISTLVNPSLTPVWAVSLNPGWKYLEHVATAFGLLSEIGDTWEGMAANPNPLLRPPNTAAGRAALIAAANRSAKKYVDNSWIQSGDVIIDPAHPSTSNTAFFTFENLVVALRAERLVIALPFGTP
jgi:hypothetical protein